MEDNKRVYEQDIIPFIPLHQPVLHAPSQVIAKPSYNTNILLDLNSAGIHIITLTGNATLAVKNASIGQEFKVQLVQDSAGSRLVTFFDGISWAGGSAPVLTATALHWDIVEFMCTASGIFNGKVYGANFS